MNIPLVVLDTNISQDLFYKGMINYIKRQVAMKRKELNLISKDKMIMNDFLDAVQKGSEEYFKYTPEFIAKGYIDWLKI